MTIRKYHFDAKAKSKSKSVTLAPGRLALFGEPHLLEDEDAAAYNELLARFWDAVKPVDIIEEMFLKDVLDLEWEVLRWRRLKWALIRRHSLESLKYFLGKNLDYQVYLEKFVDDLAALLKDLLPESEKSLAKTLARQCAEDEPQANDKVQKVLATNKRNLDTFLDDMRTEKAEELVQEYAQRDPDTLTLVNKCLAGADLSMDSLVADAVGEKLDYIERIDHLITIAENRRNAALSQIDRRRAALAETLRQSVQEIEDVEFKVLETKRAKGKTAA